MSCDTHSFFSIIILSFFFSNFVLQRTCTDSRLHAALDTIRPYGFCQDLVQLTLGELLNVGFFFFFVLLFYAHCFLEAKKYIFGFLGFDWIIKWMLVFGTGVGWGWWMGIYWRWVLLAPPWNYTWKDKCSTKEGKNCFIFYFF